MERIQIMQDVKHLYEAIIEAGDAKFYLDKQEDIDHLYEILYSMQAEPYTAPEKELLQELIQFNALVQSMVKTALDRMQKSHDLSPVVARHYEQRAYNEAYFYDKKY